MKSKSDLRAIATVVLALVAIIVGGCEGIGGKSNGPGTTNVPELECTVPSACDPYFAKNEELMHSKLLRLFDQLEMAGNEPRRQLPITQELEHMLEQCPRLVLPRLVAQMGRNVHELQRMNIAMVLGWYPAGRECTIAPLRKMLDDPLPLVRYSAAAALCDLGDDAGVATLVEALDDDRVPVRRSATQALATLAGREFASVDEARAWARARQN